MKPKKKPRNTAEIRCKKPGFKAGFFLLELFFRCRVNPPERRTDCCVALPSVPVKTRAIQVFRIVKTRGTKAAHPILRQHPFGCSFPGHPAVFVRPEPLTEKTMTAMSADRTMIKIAMSAPYLAREEERDLAIRWKDAQDQNARNQIALAHMRLVIAMASKFRGFGLPMSDLVQEGYVGLLEAAARFEPERDVRFSTYASWWIRASMQDYILRNWSIVRGGTSSAQKALFFNLRRLRAKLARGDSNLTARAIHEEIAVALGVSVSDVQTMDARLSANDASLQAPTIAGDNDSGERLDMLESGEPLPDEQVSGMIDGERRLKWLQGALTKLNDREKKIIRARRLTDDGATLEALGAELGISKERVRQIESRAIEKLKSALVSANPQMAAAAC
jgi:RNA polymerase sigma-32 factor